MATIVSDVYKFDLNTNESVREVLALVDAFEKQEKAAREAAGAAGHVGDENKKLADIEKKLASVLNQETKSVEGLTAKKEALRKINERLTAEQRKQLGITEKLAQVERDLATAATAAMRAQTGLNGSLQTGSLRIGAFIKAGAGIGALAFSFDAVAGKVQELDGFIQSAQSSIAGLTRTGAAELAGDIIGTTTTFSDLERDEVLKAIQSASVAFGKDAFDVLDEVNAGLIRAIGEKGRGELIEQVKEYSIQFAQVGATLGESIEIINLGDSLGVFSDKAADAVKEVGLRLGEATKPTVDSVTNAFGEQFSKKLFSDLKDGLSTFDAFKRISTEIGNVDLNQQQYAELVANVGGGALEDAGRKFFEAIKDVGTGVDGITEGLTEYQAAQAALLDTNREIGRTQTQVASELSGLIREYTKGTAGIRLFVTRGVLTLVTALKQLPGFIKENETELKALIAAFSITQIGTFVSGVKAITTAFKAQIIQARLLALANPYTALIAGATALVATISILTKEQSKEAELAERVAESTGRVTTEYRNEKAAVDALFKPLTDRNTTDKERAKLIDEIQNKYGDYLGNIDLEKASAEELAKAYDQVTNGILQSILARERSRLQQEGIQRIIDLQIQLNNVTDESATVTDKAAAAYARLVLGADLSAADIARNEFQKLIDAEREGLKSIDDVLKETGKQVVDIVNQFDSLPVEKIDKATKRTQKSTAQLKKETAAIKKEAETLDARLAKLGITIDASFAKSVENAGSQSEALGAILDQLEKQLTGLEGEVRKGATIETLPQLENVLAQIKEEKEIIDDARNVLARTELQVKPLDTLTGQSDILDEEFQLKVNLVEPDQKDIKAIFDTVLAGAETTFAAGFDLLSAITDSQTANLDNLVSKQEEVIAEIEGNSEEYNARQLERERERLDTLEREQTKAAERARQIAQIEVAANAALAIAKAATQPFPLNLIAIGATITGLVAGFARANAAASGAFFEGTDALQRPAGTPSGRDTILIRANEGEQIISTDETQKMQRAGIASRYDTVKYAIAGKRAHDDRLHQAQNAVQIRANANMAERMQIVGIPINNYTDAKEQRATNALLAEMLREMRREDRQPYQAPKKVRK